MGDVTSSEALLPDMDRVEAILIYRPTGNKQLRIFPAKCNFRQHFIPNYKHFVPILLILLIKGHKWKLTGDLQKPFDCCLTYWPLYCIGSP